MTVSKRLDAEPMATCSSSRRPDGYFRRRESASRLGGHRNLHRGKASPIDGYRRWAVEIALERSPSVHQVGARAAWRWVEGYAVAGRARGGELTRLFAMNLTENGVGRGNMSPKDRPLQANANCQTSEIACALSQRAHQAVPKSALRWTEGNTVVFTPSGDELWPAARRPLEYRRRSGFGR